MTQSWNPIINLAREHREMRDMIEKLQTGLTTYDAWAKKHQNFMCDPRVEMYVEDVLKVEAMYATQPKGTQH